MFGWFRPTCPVEPSAKEWLEKRMQWLTREFGPECLLDRNVILPSPEFFPDAYEGTQEDARKLFGRVCKYMKVEPRRVVLRFYHQQRPSWEGKYEGAAGLYEGRVIWVDDNNLKDPMALIGTMAHELGHVHLLGDRRVSDDTEDHEPLTDLLTVFMGLGIFTANSVLREASWQDGSMAGWSISRQGYLTMEMYGYAFALFAWYRQENWPPWSKHLRGDVYSAFKSGFKFLSKTGDSLFRPLGYRAGPAAG